MKQYLARLLTLDLTTTYQVHCKKYFLIFSKKEREEKAEKERQVRLGRPRFIKEIKVKKVKEEQKEKNELLWKKRGTNKLKVKPDENPDIFPSDHRRTFSAMKRENIERSISYRKGKKIVNMAKAPRFFKPKKMLNQDDEEIDEVPGPGQYETTENWDPKYRNRTDLEACLNIPLKKKRKKKSKKRARSAFGRLGRRANNFISNGPTISIYHKRV